MGITSTFRLLKFSLSAIHLFAWPVIALGYPLFASIRAVENGSIYQMRKLVIYWILLSLFSLIEFSFVKILQWIPFWSSVRLVVVFWFVMPQFEGACIVYHGLVRPVLLVKLQAVIYSFFNLKEERFCNRETCLDVVENYINEYGLEALEKLIASEHESQNRIDFQRGAKTKQEEENSAATSKQSISSARVRDRTNATTNVKEMTPPKASAENRRCETIPLKKTQQEWTCHLCDVTNVSRSMLNAHLQGSKHKTKVESLKASLLDEIDTGPSPLQHTQSVSAARDLKGTHVDAVVRGIMQPKETAENRSVEAPLLEKTQQEWSCDLCKVTTTSEITFNGHLQTRKHKSKVESLKASLLDEIDTGPSPLQHTQSVSAARDLKGTHVDAVVRGIMQPKETAENRSLEAPLLEKTQQEWSCDLCKVTTTSEITFNSHLQTRKHKSKLEKASMLGGKDEGPSLSATSKRNDGNVAAEKLIKESCEQEKLIASKTKCGEFSSSSSSSSHGDTEENNGSVASQQSHSSMHQQLHNAEVTQPKAETPTPTAGKWRCGLCNVEATSEKSLNDHLRGSKHKSNFESSKASLLDEIDTGPSPLQHTQSISAARDLKGTHVDAVVRGIMQPKETAENRSLEAPLLEKTQQEWSCDLCKVTTTSEITFNGHLQTRKHKSMLEKASMLGGKDEGPSLSATSKRNDGNVAAEKLIKESCEQEKLIASKTKCGEFSSSSSSSSHGDTEENNGSVASQQSHSSMHQQLHNAEVTQPKAETPTPTAGKWRCGLCNVEATSEKSLNDHLRGSKHKSNFESLKASLLDEIDTGPSPLQHTQSVSAARDLKGTYVDAVVRDIMQPKETAENRSLKPPLLEKTQQEWSCDLCKVTTTSEITFNGHLQTRKHKSKLEKASMLGGKDEGPFLSATSKRNDGNVAVEKLIKESCEQEKLIASKTKCGEFSSSRSSSHGDTEENNGSVASQQSHSSMHQQVHIHTNAEVTQLKAETPTTSTAGKWRCCLCMVEATSEKNLNDHLRGSKHKSNFESLKMSKLPATDTDTYKVNQSNLVVTKIKAGALKQYWCNVCGLKLCSYDSVASHLKGKRHSSKMNLWPEKSKKVEATIPKNMP